MLKTHNSIYNSLLFEPIIGVYNTDNKMNIELKYSRPSIIRTLSIQLLRLSELGNNCPLECFVRVFEYSSVNICQLSKFFIYLNRPRPLSSDKQGSAVSIYPNTTVNFTQYILIKQSLLFNML